jgi:hypothetical protein
MILWMMDLLCDECENNFIDDDNFMDDDKIYCMMNVKIISLMIDDFMDDGFIV